MAEHYGNSESYKYWKNYIFPTTDSTRQEKIHAIWLERVLSFRKNYGHQRGKLVEIGPGFGTFGSLALASGEFESVQVVEPVPELAEACRTRGLEVFEGRLEDVRDEVNMADIVVSFEVIEHIFCPRQFLQQCFRFSIRFGCADIDEFPLFFKAKYALTYHGRGKTYSREQGILSGISLKAEVF